MKNSLDESKKKTKRLYKKLCFIFFYLLIIYNSKETIKNPLYSTITKKFEREDFLVEDKMNCNIYDPIYLMGERLKKFPFTICNNEKSKHICYQNSKYNNYNKIASKKFGVLHLSKYIAL